VVELPEGLLSGEALVAEVGADAEDEGASR